MCLRRHAEEQRNLVTREQAVGCGFPEATIDSRLRNHRWTVVLFGVYSITGLPVTKDQFEFAAILWAQPAAASHLWAARLYGLRGITEDVVEITTAARVRHPDIVIHYDWGLGDQRLRHVDGIRVVSVERTLLGLAARISPRRFEIALDDALARRLTTLDRLESYLLDHGRQGVNGTRLFRAAITSRRAVIGQPEQIDEAEFLGVLRNYGVELPVAQHKVFVGGKFIGRPDFSYTDCDLDIECDSMRWHSGRIDLQADARRQNALIAAGRTVLRFTREDIRDRPAETAETVRKTREMLLRRVSRPSTVK